MVDLLPDVQYEAAQRDCAITTAFSADCYVHGDEELLRTAFENILRNAIKYTPGSGLVHIETASVEGSAGRFSTLSVSDNGPGIPEHELKSVLEPFYRGENALEPERVTEKLNQNTFEDALETQLIGSSLAKMRLAITGK